MLDTDQPNVSTFSRTYNRTDSDDDSDTSFADVSAGEESDDDDQPFSITWRNAHPNFTSRFQKSDNRRAKLLVQCNSDCTELEMFLKFFPKSLILHIVKCTNERLELLSMARQKLQKAPKKKKTEIPKTDFGEMLILFGSMIIMGYNRLPELHDYWSNSRSLGNDLIRKVISRDRFCLLFSKLYFNTPVKPADASKTFYIEDLVACLRMKFLQNREDSSCQSIDESMTRFKGRSSMKQYMPLKPVKRGIKMWMRSCAKSGYIYDFCIYQGKEGDNKSTDLLGERVILKLASTIKCAPTQVTLCTDRFFTSVRLQCTLPFPMVGTYITTRKNTPNFEREKLNRGDCRFMYSDKGVIASKWQDCKEVYVVTNCHGDGTCLVTRKMKTGEQKEFTCPLMTQTYNEIMGGVDISDHRISVYELNRKSNKWWKRVFVRLFTASIVNACTAYKELNASKKLSMKKYIIPLAEQMCQRGIEETKNVRKKVGRPTDIFQDPWDHFPVEVKKRRRCAQCARDSQKEKRVWTICKPCDVGLCLSCFPKYHNKNLK